MKQKTAIRQLIAELKRFRKHEATYPSNNAYLIINTIDTCITKAEGLEPVNEQQIKDAYLTGYTDAAEINFPSEINYFNETFEKP
jgi:hypothetical protein